MSTAAFGRFFYHVQLCSDESRCCDSEQAEWDWIVTTGGIPSGVGFKKQNSWTLTSASCQVVSKCKLSIKAKGNETFPSAVDWRIYHLPGCFFHQLINIHAMETS